MVIIIIVNYKRRFSSVDESKFSFVVLDSFNITGHSHLQSLMDLLVMSPGELLTSKGSWSPPNDTPTVTTTSSLYIRHVSVCQCSCSCVVGWIRCCCCCYCCCCCSTGDAPGGCCDAASVGSPSKSDLLGEEEGNSLDFCSLSL
jgi:hypothetical protein